MAFGKPITLRLTLIFSKRTPLRLTLTFGCVAANPPFLRHVTKGRVPTPTRRRPPLRYSGRMGRPGVKRHFSIPEVEPGPPPSILITQHSATATAPLSPSRTAPASDCVDLTRRGGADDDEIMV